MQQYDSLLLYLLKAHSQCGAVQVTGPVYKLVATNLGGEKRFAAAVARRLQSLGALTRGDRRAASGIDLSESNFDSPLGRKSLRYLSDARACLHVPLAAVHLKLDKSGLVAGVPQSGIVS